MAASMKLIICLVLFIGVINQGNAQECPLSTISVSQSKTGALVQGKPEWVVTIKNNCVCSRLDVKLECKGFQTVESVDPSVLTASGGVCSINKSPIFGFTSISFKYAWDSPFSFRPIEAGIACS